MQIRLLISGLGLLLALTVPGLAAEQPPLRQELQGAAQEQEQIFGSQLMTPEERLQHRERIRAAESETEREKIRQEHHQQMRIRGEQQGVVLPDEPPARGPGRGMGPGPAGGMGSGGGMGPGGGR